MKGSSSMTRIGPADGAIGCSAIIGFYLSQPAEELTPRPAPRLHAASRATWRTVHQALLEQSPVRSGAACRDSCQSTTAAPPRHFLARAGSRLPPATNTPYHRFGPA